MTSRGNRSLSVSRARSESLSFEYPKRLPNHEADSTVFYGYLILVATFITFVVSLYAILISDFVPLTGNRILDAIKEDQYYCLLVPISIPVTVYTVFFNWLGMKVGRRGGCLYTANF